MNDYLDINFYIEDESTISRVCTPMHNILGVSTETITNFWGSSGGIAYEITFVEPINPFSNFKTNIVYMNQDMFSDFKRQYLSSAANKMDVKI